MNTDKPQPWNIRWGPDIDAPYPEILTKTYPYRSTKMTLPHYNGMPPVSPPHKPEDRFPKLAPPEDERIKQATAYLKWFAWAIAAVALAVTAWGVLL
tara:strand:+ start:1485 stop:1775 length:291 start_codon:yes stop_codon:yes gene_type:complete